MNAIKWMGTIAWVSWIVLVSTDATAQPPEAATLKIYHLKHMDAKILMDVLSMVTHDPNQSELRATLDPRQNAVIVSTSEGGHQAILQIVKQMDVVPEEQLSAATALNSQLVITLLIEGQGVAVELPSPHPAAMTMLAEVAGEMPHLPRFQKPVVAGHTIVTIGSGADWPAASDRQAPPSKVFETTSSSGDNFCQLLVSGQVAQLGGNPSRFALDGQVRIEFQATPEERYRGEFRTQANLVRMSPVIFGFTEIQGIRCLLIVEMH